MFLFDLHIIRCECNVSLVDLESQELVESDPGSLV